MPLQALMPLADTSIASVVLRSLLCSAYIWSGINKLANFKSTAAGFESRLKIPAPRCAVAVTVIVQLVGSSMIIVDWTAWLGAIAP